VRRGREARREREREKIERPDNTRLHKDNAKQLKIEERERARGERRERGEKRIESREIR
jgi:hypothetical protein